VARLESLAGGYLAKFGLNLLACITKLWLTSQLKLAFYDFCLQIPGTGGKCATKIAVNALSNDVYCL